MRQDPRLDLAEAVSLQSKEKGDHTGEKGEEVGFFIHFAEQVEQEEILWRDIQKSLHSMFLEDHCSLVLQLKATVRRWVQNKWNAETGGIDLYCTTLISVPFQGQMKNNRTKTNKGHGQSHKPLEVCVRNSCPRRKLVCSPSSYKRVDKRGSIPLSTLPSAATAKEKTGLELLLTVSMCQYWIKRCRCALINSHL